MNATEYRVMWWSEDHERWFPHTTINTDRPEIAEAWLEQAIHRGPGGERTEAFIEVRMVGPWARVTQPPPVSRVQAIEAAEDHADQVAFDAWRERGQ